MDKDNKEFDDVFDEYSKAFFKADINTRFSCLSAMIISLIDKKDRVKVIKEIIKILK